MSPKVLFTLKVLFKIRDLTTIHSRNDFCWGFFFTLVVAPQAVFPAYSIPPNLILLKNTWTLVLVKFFWKDWIFTKLLQHAVFKLNVSYSYVINAAYEKQDSQCHHDFICVSLILMYRKAGNRINWVCLRSGFSSEQDQKSFSQSWFQLRLKCKAVPAGLFLPTMQCTIKVQSSTGILKTSPRPSMICHQHLSSSFVQASIFSIRLILCSS